MRVSFFLPELLKEYKEVPSYTAAQFSSFLDSLGFDAKIIVQQCEDNNFDDTSGDKLVASSISRIHDYLFKENNPENNSKNNQNSTKIETKVLLISSWYYNLPFVLEFIRKYRQKYLDDTIIILGGYAATYSTKTIFEILGSDLDFAIRGNGYVAVKDLLNHIKKLKSVTRKELLDSRIEIPGVSYLHNKKLIDTGMSEIFDIDKLPIPDYSFTGMAKLDSLYLKTSDGCKYNGCSFCTSEKFNEYQEKSLAAIDAELKEYKTKYGTTFLIVTDNTFLCNEKRAIAVSGFFKKYGFGWSCYSRIEVDESLIDKMIENNCKKIFFGYDTPDEKNFTENNKSKMNFKEYQEKSKYLFKKMSDLSKSRNDFFANFAVIDFKGNKNLKKSENIKGIRIHGSKLQYIPGTKYYISNPEKFIFDDNINFFYSRYEHYFRKR